MQQTDIAFIGSGAAATTTLIELFSKLLEQSGTHPTINITVIEKHPEFWKGVPYGSRSSINSLTITGVTDFVSVGQEKERFQTWLQTNHKRWTTYYRENGGLAAETWFDKNLTMVERGEWNDVYLPRFVFGIYMQERLLGLLHEAEDKKLVKVTLIRAEAIGISKAQAGYEIQLEDGQKKYSQLKAKKLVIAIGSAPVKSNGPEISGNSFAYINDIYSPSPDANLKLLKETLEKTTDPQKRNVLMIGSNASAIEFLYLLNHQPDILTALKKVIVISRAGRMPYNISEELLENNSANHLDELKSGSYDVHQLAAAMQKDMADAIDDTVFITHINRIIGYALELLQTLDEDSKAVFYSIYGPQITKQIRRSGPAYKGASDNLTDTGKLELIKGEYKGIAENQSGAILTYLDSENQKQAALQHFKVVINCTGSNSLKNTSSRLLKNIINENLVDLTISGEGIWVDENFRAADNLYIIGPLLAGNYNKLVHFWHLENVSRMLYLAPFLAKELLR